MNERALENPRWLRHPRKKLVCCATMGLLLNVAMAWTFDILYQVGVLTHSKSGAFHVGGVGPHDGTTAPIPQVVELDDLAVRRVLEGIAVISPDATNIGISQQLDTVHAGWPLKAVSRAWMQTELETPPPGWWFAPSHSDSRQKDLDEKWRSVWQVGTLTIPETFFKRFRPYASPRPFFLAIEPRMPGLIGNTLLYTLALCFIAFTRDARRYSRQRHGRCMRCAYDLVGLSRCPECGDRCGEQTISTDCAPSAGGANP